MSVFTHYILRTLLLTSVISVVRLLVTLMEYPTPAPINILVANREYVLSDIIPSFGIVSLLERLHIHVQYTNVQYTPLNRDTG